VSRTAILYVTERCNQACVFCLEEDGTALRPDVPIPDVLADLASLRSRGAEHITFMGGETFLRKDLPELLAETKRLGFTRVGVTTNGTALSAPGFLDRMIDAGLDFVEISVHADDAALAERISGKSFTFERQERALAELAERRAHLGVIVNVVVCAENAPRLTAVVSGLLARHPGLAPRVKLKFVSVIGAAGERETLRYDDADLAGALAALAASGADRWTYNVPLCQIPTGEAAGSHEAQALVLDWRYHDYDHRARDGYYDSGFQLEGNVWPLEPCARCTLAPICPGLEETYRARVGAGELQARADDPEPIVRAILDGAGRDPDEAPGVLERLRARPRPGRFVPPLAPKPGEAAVAFAHPEWPDPLAFEVAAADEKRPAYVRAGRLQLSFRRAARDPGRDPAGQALLAALEAALRDAAAAGLPPAEAAERIARACPAPWSCARIVRGPIPPPKDAPLAISRRPRSRDASPAKSNS
jgi:MoaA/NifB/PqqE/SkfB family radical SAM enzyme